MLPLAFSPFSLAVIGFLSPALLLYSWLPATPKQAFKRGFLFGLGFFGIGVSWVYISIHVFGQASILVSVFITAVFVSFLALFFAAQGYCFNKFFPTNNPYKVLVVFPCLFVIFEMLRTWLFTGFPWLLLGYSQTNTWLKGYAPVFGIFGLTLLTAFISGLLVLIYQRRKNRLFRLGALSNIIAILCLGLLLSRVSWTHPVGKPLKVSLVQGNIQQTIKWLPDQAFKTLTLYTDYTTKHWSSDLIIWPEAAVTFSLNQASEFLTGLSDLAKSNQTAIITGIPIVSPQASYNGMVAFGQASGVYYKRHLVPFGEYTPLKAFYSYFMRAFQIPMSNSKPGAKNQLPLIAKGIPIAPYICYEIAYPLEFLSFLPNAQLLLTITDDSWFGHSNAAMQHLQMAQMRALETGRYLLFSSNTGITALINDKGVVTETVPEFQETVLNGIVQPMAGMTPWMYWKLYPIATIIFLMLLARILKKD